MSLVFISYRQTDDEQKRSVRALAERLRECGIDVVLDQFFQDKKAGGPNEGWPKWSSDNALNAQFVLIIGTQGWFECFEGTQKPGTGLGAACEAADIRTRIYDAAGVIENIRVVLFDDADRAHLPGRLRPYHHFHAFRDFKDIVRWLGGHLMVTAPRTSIPHNLPSLQPFFGRDVELRKIADALDPESRTWGALIDGPGGIGKTSLAVRAAYDASPDVFEKIAFVSLKSRELDDDGVRDLSSFLISGLAELLNELARELGHADIAKATKDQRPRMLLEVLRGTRTLLVLDNLESLIKKDRDTVFTFVKKLPHGCKAILTSRQRIGSAAEELILERLDEGAAVATLAKLAENNPALAKTNTAERIQLYHETGGKPLLLRWTAGQIGRGSCLTLTDAIKYLHTCPEGNDPLEFIFGDLAESFSQTEILTICALTYFTLPAKVEHIAAITKCSEAAADTALRSLVNRSLVVPNEEFTTFTLVQLVAEFLRKKMPAEVDEAGKDLEKCAASLLAENGFNHYDRFSVLEATWPCVAAALSVFFGGSTDRLNTVCSALDDFLHFTGRWDEWLALSRDTERRLVDAKMFSKAGWRIYQQGYVHYLRGESAELLACADRAEAHWREAETGDREIAVTMRLRGLGHHLSRDYLSAISVYRKVVEILRTLDDQIDVAVALNDLAGAERAAGDLEAATRHLDEALHIARASDDFRENAIYTSNLAELAFDREDLFRAESLAFEALELAENLGLQALIAVNCNRLALILLRQGKKSEAIAYAERAVEIFRWIKSPNLADACRILAECQT